MITFYPGPSKLHPKLMQFMQRAMDSGVPGLNHRSGEFTAILKNSVAIFKENLGIPENYLVTFVSSATECWEIIAQSFIKHKSLHVFNGAFGERWWHYTSLLREQALAKSFGLNEVLNFQEFANHEFEVLCLTHNETSNGTKINDSALEEIRALYPEALIAVDATSSMGGVHIDFELADIWYTSVQKCFGLPPGMGVITFSPKAIEHGLKINDNKHYNSFANLYKNAIKWQTTHTPNTLLIYLLGEIFNDRPTINVIDKQIKEQANDWYQFIESLVGFELLCDEKSVRSETVVTVALPENELNIVKQNARDRDIILGRGYGNWLHKTFRIANFPAIEMWEIERLKEFLYKQSRKLWS